MRGYLAAISASSYSYVSLLKHFIPTMNPGGASISLTYIASERVIPGYGGGMSSAKVLWRVIPECLLLKQEGCCTSCAVRVKSGEIRQPEALGISAELKSKGYALLCVGFIDTMIEYSLANAPMQKELLADEVGNAAAFLASPLASAITGTVIYVDNGLHAMGVGVDNPIFADLNIPQSDPKNQDGHYCC